MSFALKFKRFATQTRCMSLLTRCRSHTKMNFGCSLLALRGLLATGRTGTLTQATLSAGFVPVLPVHCENSTSSQYGWRAFVQ
jgi:hypothetical protein